MELDSLLLVYFLNCSIKFYTRLVSLVDDKIQVSLVEDTLEGTQGCLQGGELVCRCLGNNRERSSSRSYFVFFSLLYYLLLY